METTFDINENLLQRLREVANRRGTTASALVEAGIFRILGEELETATEKATAESLPKLPTWHFGEMLVDISNREELYRVMDGHDGFRY